MDPNTTPFYERLQDALSKHTNPRDAQWVIGRLERLAQLEDSFNLDYFSKKKNQ